ncbi:MAG TPA: DNA cytosine methyltransferase, partial [Longimicrobium sp.]|nr:DNA cytosine methyltransferase [Longimicrobium sp.]
MSGRVEVVDLFAGPGGWDVALAELGLRVVGLKWDRWACATRAAGGHATIQCDVAAYPVEPFRGVRGLVASPPCQAWSNAGKGGGRKEIAKVHAAVELCRRGWTDAALAGPWADERTPLILQPLRWAWGFRESLEWIACEQVPPCLPVWEHVADVLRSWGFDARARVLNAADYGVPQTRERAVLVASRRAARLPVATHAQHDAGMTDLFGGPPRPKWVTMAMALGWGMTERPALTLAPGTASGGPDVVGGSGARAALERERTSGRWRLRGNQRPPGQDDYHSVPVDRPAQALTGNTSAYRWIHERPATT